jgi:hypothetical protein
MFVNKLIDNNYQFKSELLRRENANSNVIKGKSTLEKIESRFFKSKSER